MSLFFSKSLYAQDPDFGKDPVEIFDKGFGGAVRDDEVYYDPWRKVDKRKRIGKALMQRLMKANPSLTTTSGGAGTAGSALIPVHVDPELVDRTRFETPIRGMTPRRAVRGKTYDYVIRTAKGGANWRSEDAPLPEDIDTYDRGSVNIKYGYSVGRITGPTIASMRGFIDAEALDLDAKTAALIELEEDTIINGDASTYTTEFTGLISSITTNTTNKNGTDYPTLADIRAEFDTTYQAKGRVTVAVTDSFTHSYIKGLLMDFQRQPAPPAENIPFGIPGAFNFDGVDFIKSQFMPTTSGSRRILFLDMRYIFMAVLQDITYQEIGHPNDSFKYMLKVYEALVVTFEAAMSQIYGIL